MSRHVTFQKAIAALAIEVDPSVKFTRFDITSNSMSARLAILGSNIAVNVDEDGNGRFNVGAYGFGPAARRWLHDVLVVHSRLVIGENGRELQVLRSRVASADLVVTIKDAAKLLYELRAQEEAADYRNECVAPMYWSSGVLNFGDWSGPHLVHKLTGRQPVQSNRPGSGTRVLYSVGSILGWIKRHNVDVWGSGLIKPLTNEEILERNKLKGIRIHAVRGRLTKTHLEKSLDWEVPEVFGDPALLLPRIMPFSANSSAGTAIVPHHIHKPMLESNSSIDRLVDVRADVYDVCRFVSASSAVISSSLHGLIVAQAFDIPWVWLRIVDKPLIGDDFKFEDFFSCLDRNKVAIHSVHSSELSDLDFNAVASVATVPGLTIDLDLLERALPLEPAIRPVKPSPRRDLFY